MNLIEWKRMREKVKTGQLNEQDIELLIKDNIIENEEEEVKNINNEESGMTNQYQKVMRHPSIPSTSPEIETEYEKAGFSNAILLALISFVSEILFIGLTILLYK